LRAAGCRQLSLHDALPIFAVEPLATVDHREEGDDLRGVLDLVLDEGRELLEGADGQRRGDERDEEGVGGVEDALGDQGDGRRAVDRKSTRLNSSHVKISYA